MTFINRLSFLVTSLSLTSLNFATLSNSECHTLPYRPEVKIVCTKAGQGLTDCYSSKFPRGSFAIFSCSNNYISRGEITGGRLTCGRNGFWKGFSSFQALECRIECGVPKSLEPYIIGAEPTIPDLWPWHAILFKRVPYTNEFGFLCGGTLIETENEGLLILTAAHCVSDLDDGPGQIKVGLGANSSDYDVVRGNKRAKIYNVKQVLVHDYFDSVNLENDIALLKLDGPVCLTNNIVPVCLSGQDSKLRQVNLDEVGHVVGFGQYVGFKNGVASDFLRHAQIPIVSQAECNAWRYKKLSSSKICGGYLTGESGTCKGDSGGGLVFSYDEGKMLQKYYIQGIVSYGPPELASGEICYSYSVFTKVTSFISWIHDAQFIESNYDDRRRRSEECEDNVVPKQSIPMVAIPTSIKTSTNSTASTSTSTPSTSIVINLEDEIYSKPTDVQLEALKVHNEYRRRNGVPLLKLNASLSMEAESFAERLIRENIFINLFQPGKNFNKNIYEIRETNQETDAPAIVRRAIEDWYSKIDEYSSLSPKASTFTQVVWKSTTDLGIGVRSILQGRNQRRTVVVATYYPRGNTGTPDNRYYKENVPNTQF